MDGARGPAGGTIASILLTAEGVHARRPALLVGEEALDFATLADGARRLATHLAGVGVGQGSRVALVLRNGTGFVTAHYAVALLGAVAVPLSPDLDERQRRAILERADVTCSLCSTDLADGTGAGSPGGMDRTARIVLPASGASLALRAPDGSVESLEQTAALARPAPSAPQDPAVLFFTSGTTGAPKGVQLTHAQVLFGLDAWVERWSFDERTRSLMAAPFFHVVYNPLVLGAHRCGGAAVVPASPAVGAVAAAVERHAVTALMGTPALMRQLAGERWSRRHDLSSLESLIYGAAPTPPEVIRALGERFPHAERFNCYGMTETSSALTCLGGREVDGREGSVGRAHPGVSLRIVDAEGRDLPPGEAGEVCARGPNVIDAYVGAPRLDAQRFLDGWLRTGDLGVLDADGRLTLRDRLDDQINVAGEKFYPFQIEAVLAAAPGVGDVAAVGVADALRGRVVHAFVTPEGEEDVDLEDLRRRCIDGLPACIVPRRITLLDDLPRNPSGKVDRRLLASGGKA
ncbi:MAG: class I adenylate-forming enzyme family protein [Planctomycetota bacterium]|jgi:acyl-CoA synthetase (AMP-forming)/AMP-acid ligase II|nr:class I adenylate-forming enzyme family protein [Planctomycetota bacterium]MDP6761389.1 class I adenylate-forming enzyme family protein [Planctomycetota bacterium]MDP6989406.1 class I adenylate-forming enzyme family protein [Planctomycetota bacterium]